MIFCSKCGKMLRNNEEVCPNCGTKTTKAPAGEGSKTQQVPQPAPKPAKPTPPIPPAPPAPHKETPAQPVPPKTTHAATEAMPAAAIEATQYEQETPQAEPQYTEPQPVAEETPSQQPHEEEASGQKPSEPVKPITPIPIPQKSKNNKVLKGVLIAIGILILISTFRSCLAFIFL